MARQMLPEEYQELGRRYFKLKEYEKAAESFTQGIAVSPSVSLYDHRAACNERLKDLNSAVKDGREMIKLDKKDVKGYLRTASVLEKMEKPDTALGIYKYGMKNVPVDDKNFKLLQQLHDKLTRKLSPAMAADPFTILPVELVEMVLEYLSFRNMVNCMRVSRGWRDYLARLPRMWMHLDLTGARKAVPRAFVDKAVRRSKNNLTRMTVHRFEHTDMLKTIARVCKSLTDLEFLTTPGQISASLIEIVQLAPNSKTLVMHPDITLDTVTQIFHHRPTLHHVDMRSITRASTSTPTHWKGPFPNLQTLSLTYKTISTFPLIEPLLAQSPTLHHLSLTNLTLTPQPPSLANMPLTSLILKRISSGPFPILPPTLRRLTLEYTGKALVAQLLPPARKSHLPSLTHLSLSGIDTLDGTFLTSLLDIKEEEEEDGNGDIQILHASTSTCTPTPTPLHHLSLRVLPPKLLTSSPRLLTPSLQTLDLSTTPCTDDDIEALLSHAQTPNLRGVNLAQTRVTGAAVKMLVDGLRGLEGLCVDGCEGVRGRDAVGYAGRRGVVVSALMGGGGKGGGGKGEMGGRRVRW